MLPALPKELTKASLENLMFDGLSKLSDDYYVFHSFKIISIESGVIKESETDFLIFNKTKGIICIEAKAGKVSYENGFWRYGNGTLMKGDGPFSQATRNRWNVKRLIDEKCNNLTSKCKIIPAVWFPSISRSQINSIAIPSDTNKNLIMTRESLDNPQEIIDRIFSLGVAINLETTLTPKEADELIRKVLCPKFDLVPSRCIELDIKRNRFHHLLKEQSTVLDFLEEQRCAVVNGVAGTGKTMLAVEKARRCGIIGETLFLCYNVRLKEYLEKTFPYDNVSYYTIDGFACKFCKTITPDYNYLDELLTAAYVNNTFNYNHLIIDEGQDFGQENIEQYKILQTLEDIILSNEIGTFYMFYDKLQLVQGTKIPKFIEDADCRLTLYKNCRNTRSIASTSLKPLDRQPKLFDGAVEGDMPSIHFVVENGNVKINSILDSWLDKGINDIVIITSKTEKSSFMTQYAQGEIYHYRNKDFIFNSTRRFKGLEADVIILIDVDRDILLHSEKIFYVGSSRARLGLDIIANMSESDCIDTMKKLNCKYNGKSKNKQLANALGCLSK